MMAEIGFKGANAQIATLAPYGAAVVVSGRGQGRQTRCVGAQADKPDHGDRRQDLRSLP